MIINRVRGFLWNNSRGTIIYIVCDYQLLASGKKYKLK